ncbi:MAG: MarR family transcriptional regulator [Verrucomicrobia bacterium]|nr:MarR family transcriptional regulator [Verrucomicrobiota bacterium]MCF7709247.1 MarR family transcriptional regulator [Verrucomicrobiota bacterium]
MRRNLCQPGPRHDALIRLLQTAEVIWEGSRILFSRWALSPSQFNLLNLLKNEPAGMSQTELGRQLVMHKSNVTGLVDRLQKRGLVDRRKTLGDRRAYSVVITEKGRRIIAEILPHYYSATESVMAPISLKRVNDLISDISRIMEHAHQLTHEVKDRK